jgi:putative ABC transport system permease protein
VVTASVRLSTLRYADSSKQAAFFQHALDRIEASPGVISAGATSALVHLENGRTVTFSVEGRDLVPRKERAKAEYFAITPRFLDTLRVPVRRGRGFAPQDDTQGHPVAIVNEAFARRYFPDGDALGRHLRLDAEDADRSDWSEIVGVVGNLRDKSDEWEERPHVYEPYLQRPCPRMTLAVRTASDPAAFASVMRGAIWTVDKEQPVSHVQTMEQVIADSRAGGVLITALMGSYAGVALAMAMIGVFGVMASTVAQRTHEIGIRMALGADAGDVRRMVPKKGIFLGTLGVAIGLGLAAPLAWLPLNFVGIPFNQRVGVVLATAGLLWLVALVASYIPARRASRVDPTVALRYE